MATKTSNPMEIQKALSGMQFPADKQQIINYAKSKGASGEIINAINGLPDRQYTNSEDISSEMSTSGDMGE